MIKKPFLLLVVISFLWWQPAAVIRAQTGTTVPVFVLLKTEANKPERLAEVQAFIASNEGRTLHVFPFQALIAKAPTDVIESLTHLPNVAAVLTEPVEPTTMDVYGPQARRWAVAWNNLIAPAPFSAAFTPAWLM